MTEAKKKVERIEYLMKELLEELQGLPKIEKELEVKIISSDRETQDILHIMETFEMTKDESDKVVEHSHKLRKERRETKHLLEMVKPIRLYTYAFLPSLKNNCQQVSNIVKNTCPGQVYKFRTDNGYTLLTSLAPDFASRSGVRLQAPTGYVAPKAGEKPAPSTSTESPLYSHTVENKVCLGSGVSWTYHQGNVAVFSSRKLSDVMEFLYTNGVRAFGTNKKSHADFVRLLKPLIATKEEGTEKEWYQQVYAIFTDDEELLNIANSLEKTVVPKRMKATCPLYDKGMKVKICTNTSNGWTYYKEGKAVFSTPDLYVVLESLFESNEQEIGTNHQSHALLVNTLKRIVDAKTESVEKEWYEKVYTTLAESLTP